VILLCYIAIRASNCGLGPVGSVSPSPGVGRGSRIRSVTTLEEERERMYGGVVWWGQTQADGVEDSSMRADAH
jgi:hypothetical protein